MDRVMRYQFADFLGVGDSSTYELMGVGFKTLDENPGAQTESTTYVCDKTSSSYVKGYETQFPYESDLIKSEAAVMALYETGRDHKTGSDAEFDYVRVDLYNPVASQQNKFKARKFRVSNAVDSLSGEGGAAVSVSGNLNAIGDPVQGVFDMTTKTFTEGEGVAGQAASAPVSKSSETK